MFFPEPKAEKELGSVVLSSIINETVCWLKNKISIFFQTNVSLILKEPKKKKSLTNKKRKKEKTRVIIIYVSMSQATCLNVL